MAITTINGDSGSATGTVITLTGSTSGAYFTALGATITASFNYVSLPSTTSTDGQIKINSIPFMHAYGTQNTFLGGNAGNFTNTSTDMVGIGFQALQNATGGGTNGNNGTVAIGNNAGRALTSDSNNNVIIGGVAGQSLTSSNSGNVIIGGNACTNAGTGFQNNVAIGLLAMDGATKTSATNNVAIGDSVASNITSGSYNCFIGASGVGQGVTTGTSNISINGGNVGNVSNRLVIGAGAGSGTKQLTTAFIHGIRGITTGVNDAIAVLIDSAGQLGTVSSSIRYKENVSDMGDVSSPILDLRPVTFDFIGKPSHKKQVGLIAEEVEKVMPLLVAYNSDGEVESVKYHELPVLLLNELQKVLKRIEVLESKVN